MGRRVFLLLSAAWGAVDRGWHLEDESGTEGAEASLRHSEEKEDDINDKFCRGRGTSSTSESLSDESS